jgi:hypothetical protein
MPSVRIPLVGSYNTRPQDSQEPDNDQRFVGCIFDIIDNSISNQRTAYVMKRPAFVPSTTGISSSISAGTFGTAVYKASGGVNEAIVASFGTTNSQIVYCASLSAHTVCGTVTGKIRSITDVIIGGILYFLMLSSDGTGWYLSESAATDATPTFTADVANTSAVLTNVSSTTNVYVGQALSGTGIAAGARVQSIDSATQITMTAAATATNAGQTITFTRIAKIIDANFPSSAVGGFAELGGWIFVMTSDGKIYNSDLNSITSWTDGNYIPSDFSTDNGVGCVRYGNYILGFGSAGTEIYENAGGASNSPLRRVGAFGIGAWGLPGGDTRYLSYVPHKGNVYWIASPQGTGFGVYAMEGLSPKKISPRRLDKQMVSSYISVGDVDGKTYVFVESSGTNFSVWLDPETGTFTEAGYENVASSTHYILAAGGGTDSKAGFTYAVMGGGDSGHVPDILRLSGDTFQDPISSGSGFANVSTKVQLARQDFGSGNRKFLKSIELVADTQASGTTTLEISKDDFTTWTTLGTFDMTKAKKIIYRCGSFTGGASLRLTHSANTAWRAEALIVEYEVGVH